MELSSSLLFGVGANEWQERINFKRMREERAERLRKVMRKHKVAACILARSDNMRYATGMPGAGFVPQLSYCFFSVEHEPVIFEHAGRHAHMKDQAPWIKPENHRIARSWLGGICGPEASWEEAKIFVREIAQEMRDKGLKGERLGMVGFDAITRGALNEIGIETFDMWPLMLETRAVKTKDEINCLKMICAIADAAFYRMYEAMKPGIRDVDISGAGLKAVMEAGADSPGVIATFSGPLTFERGWPNTDRIIQVGDMVYIDICNTDYLGYKACYYRSFIVGRKATDKEKDWHKRVLDKQNAILSEMKPGNTTADAAKYFTPASAWGHPEEVHVLTIEIAHGIGLHLYEMPVVNQQWSLKHPQVFEVGNVIAVESSVGEWRVGGSRLEDMVVITEKGAELLGRWPRDEIVVANAVV